MPGRDHDNKNRVRDDATRMIEVLLAVDASLYHEKPLLEDAPRPAWCHVFMRYFEIDEGECCGICPELSEVTVQALDKAYSK